MQPWHLGRDPRKGWALRAVQLAGSRRLAGRREPTHFLSRGRGARHDVIDSVVRVAKGRARDRASSRKALMPMVLSIWQLFSLSLLQTVSVLAYLQVMGGPGWRDYRMFRSLLPEPAGPLQARTHNHQRNAGTFLSGTTLLFLAAQGKR